MSRVTPRTLVATVTGLAVIAALTAVVLSRGGHERHLTAEFPSTVSLYAGANVEVLGVPVGKVTGIHVDGDHVDVAMEYSDNHRLPSNVHAVIVPPSIVGDRYVELTPAYTGGPALADHSVIHEASTQVPVEVDQVYASLNDLSAALGPRGANNRGALSQLLNVVAKNLNGNGQDLHDTIGGLSNAINTLADSRGNIASSVTNLSQISQTLADDDPQVRHLARLLATVSTELNRQDSNLTHATKSLNRAFADVARFVGHNRNALTSDVADLTDVSKTIADHKDAVATALDLAPLGLTDLWESYVPENWDISHPVGVNINGMTTATTARGNLFEDVLDQLGFSLSGFCASLPPQQAKKLSALCSAIATTPGGLAGVLGGLANATAPKHPAHYPPTLAGLLLAGNR